MTIKTIINDDPAEYDFDGIKKCMIEMYDYEDGNIPDKDVWEYIYNDIEYSYDEGLRDINVDTEGEIIAIASMGLWNGRCSGYAILYKNNLKEILYCGNKDFNHLYYDGFNVYKKASHHDGTNHIMFREVRPDVDIEKLFDKIYNNEPISKATLNRYTRSLRRYVKQIYGW